MNGNTTKRKRQMLITKYGEFCRCCGKLPDEGTLVLNRIDNNNKNTRLENLQLLCRSCVNLRNKTDEHDDLCVNTQTKEETCLTINKKKEPLFREMVYCDLIEYREMLYTDIINSEAEFLGVSPATTKRYLDKMTSSSGYLTTRQNYQGLIVKFASEIKEQFAKMGLKEKGIIVE